MFLLVLLCELSALSIVSATAQTCYYPDKNVAPADVPCNSDSGASACCNEEDICLDNHLCLQTKGYPIISRGSCTDETWQSAECAQFCQDVTIDYGQPLFPIEPYRFCCGPGFTSNQSCNTSTHGSYQPFEVAAGNVIFNRSDGSIDPNSTVNGSSASNNVEIAIGVGVGLPLGITVLVLLGLLLNEMRRKRNLQQEAQAWERKCLGLMRRNMCEGKESKATRPLVELSGWPMDELHGDSPVTDKFENKL